MFFFLAQTEQGDIFKITLETDEDMVSVYKLIYLFIVKIDLSTLRLCMNIVGYCVLVYLNVLVFRAMEIKD